MRFGDSHGDIYCFGDPRNFYSLQLDAVSRHFYSLQLDMQQPFFTITASADSNRMNESSGHWKET